MLIGAAVSLFFNTVSTAAAGAIKKVKFLRPPGSLPEDEFLARCTKCQKCLQACHTRVITPLSFSAGFSVAGTPTISFRKNYCDLCMKCVDVCPFGAIKPIKKEEVRIGIAVIIKEACVAWDWEGCVNCIEKCPEKAIELDEHKRPYIINEKCNGCGICELVCPTMSLRSAKINKKGVIVVPWGEEGNYE